MKQSDVEWAQGQDPRVKRLEEENARLSRLLGLVESYQAAAGKPPKWMSRRSSDPGRATACLQLSDLHLDEVVRPEEVGSLNAYSREIAEARLQRWAAKACDMGYRLRVGHKWDGAVLFLGGDFVSGSIHDELRETNEDYLPATLTHWAPRLAAALGEIVTFFRRVHVVGVVGNHGRLTMKKQAKGRGRNSWDWLLYSMVQSHFAKDDRVSWELAEGSYLFVPVYGRHAFFTHGDEVGGGGGWAGVWSPLGTIARRGIELGQKHGIRVSYAVVGHWHQTTLAHARGIVCSGALKGWDEYAASLRLAPEPPMQNMWVETPTHGTTLASALFVGNREREGW